MKKLSLALTAAFFASTGALSIGASSSALACAQGCGVFNVGTSTLIPNQQGGILFTQYDYVSQTRNWKGEHKSDGHNHHNRIETQTLTLGGQYMFNRDWGLNVCVPYVTRFVADKAEDSMMGMGEEASSHRNSDIGDVRVSGIYSGFFDDMSTGVTFGVKLPTGSTNSKSFGIQNQIGTGSTDILLGFYHMGKVANSSKLTYFTQASYDRPVVYKDHFKPGYEASGAVGTSYNFGSVMGLKRVAPIVQITAAHKGKDSLALDESHGLETGYSQVNFTPAIELGLGDYRLYADIGLPIYQRVNGNQLVAQRSFKVILGKNF